MQLTEIIVTKLNIAIANYGLNLYPDFQEDMISNSNPTYVGRLKCMYLCFRKSFGELETISLILNVF